MYLLRAGISMFCNGLIFISLAAYYVRTIGMNPLQLVLVGTVLEATVFFFEVPTGIVADRYSRRLSVLIGGFLVGVCYVLTGLAPFFLAIIIAESIRGIGTTFISGAESAWITDEVGVDQIRNLFMRRVQVGQVANLIGIWCSVLLASLWTYQVPILIGGIGLILLNVYSIFAMPETNFLATPRNERNTFHSMLDTLREGINVIGTNRILMLLMATALIAGAASEGFDRLVEAHYLQNLNMPVLVMPVIGRLDPIAWFAIWNIAAVLLGLTVIEVARHRLNTDQPVHAAMTLMVLDAVVVVSTILFGLTRSFAIAFLSELLRHTSRQLSGPIRNTWLNQNIPSKIRATVISVNDQADSLGQMAGGPGVGLVGTRFGIRAALVLGGVLLMPTVALYGRTIRHERLRSSETQHL
jgi:MFS transporter, DHA3 family, tetracycline resistance protein